MEKINTLINELETLKPDLFGKDFLFALAKEALANF